MENKKLKWEDPSLIEFTNPKAIGNGIPGNCNPTGGGAAECFTGYAAVAYCGPGGDGQN